MLSIPRVVYPSSKIRMSLFGKSYYTWVALTGEIWLNLFALGAAIGTFDYLISYKAILLLGILTPTNSELDVTISDTIYFFLHNRVKGPGQNFLLIILSIYFSLSVVSIIDNNYYKEQQWTIKGSVNGLSLVR